MLTLKGLNIDVVEKVGRVRVDAYHEWWSMASMQESARKLYPSGVTWSDAFWRTLWMDVDFRTRSRADERALRLHNLWWWAEMLRHSKTNIDQGKVPIDQGTATTLREDEELLNALTTLHEKALIPLLSGHIASCSEGRTFFLSKQGYMGMAPGNACAGDNICILYGGRVPYLLRKVRVDLDSTPHRWEFLGDAYVHGLMDGEAMESIGDYMLDSRDFSLI